MLLQTYPVYFYWLEVNYKFLKFHKWIQKLFILLYTGN